MDELRVLIVEDNHHMSAILRTLLQAAGFRDIVEARDAESAFAMLADVRPDLALVDYQLEGGGQDGIAFTLRVRTDPESPCRDLPIILVTAHSERSRAMAAIDAGVNEFVVKPVSPKAVIDRVRAVIEHPRPFITNDNYAGPDRRRRDDPNYTGPRRRAEDDDGEEAVRI
ncbi:MAG: response regulator [Maricaulaceae bacterium]|jgi:DNA-binding response OmpR family regulator